MGLPRSTLQSRFDRAIGSLREDLDREHGSRKAWIGLFGPWLSLYPEPVTGPGLSTGAGSGLKLAGAVTLAVGAGIGAMNWKGPETAQFEGPELEGPELAAAEPNPVKEAIAIEAPVAQRELTEAATAEVDGALLDEKDPGAAGRRVPLVVRLWNTSGEPVASGSLTLGDGRGRRYVKRFIDVSEIVFERVATGPAEIRAFIGGVTAVEHSFGIQGEAPVVDLWVAPSGLLEVVNCPACVLFWSRPTPPKAFLGIGFRAGDGRPPDAGGRPSTTKLLLRSALQVGPRGPKQYGGRPGLRGCPLGGLRWAQRRRDCRCW